MAAQRAKKSRFPVLLDSARNVSIAECTGCKNSFPSSVCEVDSALETVVMEVHNEWAICYSCSTWFRRGCQQIKTEGNNLLLCRNANFSYLDMELVIAARFVHKILRFSVSVRLTRMVWASMTTLDEMVNVNETLDSFLWTSYDLPGEALETIALGKFRTILPDYWVKILVEITDLIFELLAEAISQTKFVTMEKQLGSCQKTCSLKLADTQMQQLDAHKVDSSNGHKKQDGFSGWQGPPKLKQGPDSGRDTDVCFFESKPRGRNPESTGLCFACGFTGHLARNCSVEFKIIKPEVEDKSDSGIDAFQVNDNPDGIWDTSLSDFLEDRICFSDIASLVSVIFQIECGRALSKLNAFSLADSVRCANEVSTSSNGSDPATSSLTEARHPKLFYEQATCEDGHQNLVPTRSNRNRSTTLQAEMKHTCTPLRRKTPVNKISQISCASTLLLTISLTACMITYF